MQVLICMVIIITKPGFFEGEAQRIAELLSNGTADIIHIRKPKTSQFEVEQLLEAIPSELYSKLVLHDHLQLAVKYGLHGVHLNSRNPEPPEGWSGSVSISCHSLDELARRRHQPYTYLSLSPIFDSISKQGYRSAFTAKQIAAVCRLGIIDHRVMALGGITFGRVTEVLKMGFGGAMILGDAWK